MFRFKLNYNSKLGLIFIVALLSVLIIESVFTISAVRKDRPDMQAAAGLAEQWFNDIGKMKKEREVFNEIDSRAKYSYLIGDEYTDITTTIGSLRAKEISANPEFAALILRYLTDCKIDSAESVGVILSGSFPALAISSLAAIQTINAKAIIFSSVGASMYGANQPGATWIDIENYLRENSNLKYNSYLVSLGGENDAGGGLSEEGIQILKKTASRYNIDLYIPKTLRESIEEKVQILQQNKIGLLINIGGNQTSLGACVHSLNIPNGLCDDLETCNDEDRGIIMRISERGIPFVNLLNIHNLAIESEISTNSSVNSAGSIYMEKRTDKIPVVLSLIVITGLLTLVGRYKNQL